jgi:hypothetical protein
VRCCCNCCCCSRCCVPLVLVQPSRCGRYIASVFVACTGHRPSPCCCCCVAALAAAVACAGLCRCCCRCIPSVLVACTGHRPSPCRCRCVAALAAAVACAGLCRCIAAATHTPVAWQPWCTMRHPCSAHVTIDSLFDTVMLALHCKQLAIPFDLAKFCRTSIQNMRPTEPHQRQPLATTASAEIGLTVVSPPCHCPICLQATVQIGVG